VSIAIAIKIASTIILNGIENEISVVEATKIVKIK